MQCYICQQQTTTIEEHHIVPRFAGGEDGPTVNLCADCHAGIHRQALNLLAKHGKRRCYFTKPQLERAKPLIQQIVIALQQAKENKDDTRLINIGQIKLPAGFVVLLHSIKMDEGFKNMETFISHVLLKYVRDRI